MVLLLLLAVVVVDVDLRFERNGIVGDVRV